MTLYLSQKCWGRSCLHLAAALRAGHWRWHLAGIKRETQLAGSHRSRASATAGGAGLQAQIFRPIRIMNTMPLNLTKCRKTKCPENTHQIVGLLKTVGMPNWMLYVRRLSENGSFWLRRIDHLRVLEQARHLYRQQIVCVHPDKAGGSLAQTIQLNNDTWGKIERRFKIHGHELW